MPTLNWIGKDAIVHHHQTVPYRLWRDVPEFGVGKPGTGKGAHLLKADEAREKAAVGAVWEQRSGGKCLLAMPGKDGPAAIKAKLAR